MVKAGTVITGPEGERYRLSRDLHVAEPITADLLIPINREPALVGGEMMPSWIGRALTAASGAA